MPIHYDQDLNKWVLNLTAQENNNIKYLIGYLEAHVKTETVFIDRNHKANSIADLRLYEDEDFYHS